MALSCRSARGAGETQSGPRAQVMHAPQKEGGVERISASHAVDEVDRVRFLEHAAEISRDERPPWALLHRNPLQRTTVVLHAETLQEPVGRNLRGHIGGYGLQLVLSQAQNCRRPQNPIELSPALAAEGGRPGPRVEHDLGARRPRRGGHLEDSGRGQLVEGHAVDGETPGAGDVL